MAEREKQPSAPKVSSRQKKMICDGLSFAAAEAYKLLRTNLLFTLSSLPSPEIGTVRETFFCNQIAAAGHRVEYGGLKTGDFRVGKKVVIEVGGPDKGFDQIQNEEEAYVAADGIESSVSRKIPLWAFGFLY